jgi:flavin reductase (DIM6/NTAB) family NADH-FMN oxidoreductase RutF
MGGKTGGTEPATVFREVMAGVCTPVAVVTALDGDRPHGTTVSAFASLSLEPPMVLVSLARSSNLLAIVRATGRFGLNVLGSTQAALAARFAGKGASKFDEVAWSEDHGLPRLDGAPGWLACEVSELVAGGDHLVALGIVVGAATAEKLPLTYHRRVFGTHAPLAEASAGATR